MPAAGHLEEPLEKDGYGADVVELRVVVTALALAAAMLLSALIGWRRRVGALLLLLLSFVWLTVDKEWEGPILVSLDSKHALTTADLFALAGVAVSLWLWARLRPRR